ncbi:MAG: hypothetical protein ACOYOK_15175 [Pseudobdellovibrionaceae bacterium]
MFTELNQQVFSSSGVLFLWLLLLQGALLIYDEAVLHRQREMPNWERWGHPVDTFFFLLPLALGGFLQGDFSQHHFIGLCILSCLVILKDEWVHAGRIKGFEGLVHGLLFILHPIVLFMAYRNLLDKNYLVLQTTSMVLTVVMVFQFLFWNWWEPKTKKDLALEHKNQPQKNISSAKGSL